MSRCIRLEDINFAYPGSETLALKNLSLEIQAKSSVAFVGGSGAGKTTCIDLLLGLIEAKDGKMLVDDVEVRQSNVREWQNNIGYVPQNIYLADATISENIAFGIEREKIDIVAVVNAAKMASLDEFINNELPEGYQTMIGEHGVRLSGGQRQRIGIARALYHNPEVLVLDEATSALDTPTEQAIMEAIHNLSGQKTIMIVAHRISTVRECSMIFHLENGALVECGTFDSLLDYSDEFRKLAHATVPARAASGIA